MLSSDTRSRTLRQVPGLDNSRALTDTFRASHGTRGLDFQRHDR